MNESILISIKKLLEGVYEEDDTFDAAIITHINTAFSLLQRMGVGPDDGFSIDDDTAEWYEFTDDRKEFISVKSYVYLKVKLIFDPPSSGILMEAIKENIKELEWTLNYYAENEDA